MDLIVTFGSINNIISGIAIAAGAIFVIIELTRHGLGIFSFLAFACFVAGVLFMSGNFLNKVIPLAVLVCVYIILINLYKREKRNPHTRDNTEDEDNE